MTVKQINQQQMQSCLNDKENEIPTIPLDFKKKAKSKPNSERTSSSSSLLKIPNAKMITSNTICLLQKKKQYSQTLREKNLQKQGKKSRHQEVLQEKIYTQIEKFNAEALKLSTSINTSTFSSGKTQNQKQMKRSTKPFLNTSTSKKDQKIKPRDSTRQKSKIHQTSLMIEGAKSHKFNHNFSIMSSAPSFIVDQSAINQDFSVLEKINDLSRIQKSLQICSRQVNECVEQFESEKQKQAQLIKRQNNTFKKQLAAFRKENASLKREMDQLKKQLAVFQQRNQYLQNQSSEQIKMLQTLQIKINQPLQALPKRQMKDQQSESLKNQEIKDENLREIIQNYENELFQATNLNKKLEFRNYMLQKKIMDQAELHKKQMIKEISVWKQRYVKARNQNIKLKDSRTQMLFEMSICEQL